MKLCFEKLVNRPVLMLWESAAACSVTCRPRYHACMGQRQQSSTLRAAPVELAGCDFKHAWFSTKMTDLTGLSPSPPCCTCHCRTVQASSWFLPCHTSLSPAGIYCGCLCSQPQWLAAGTRLALPGRVKRRPALCNLATIMCEGHDSMMGSPVQNVSLHSAARIDNLCQACCCPGA